MTGDMEEGRVGKKEESGRWTMGDHGSSHSWSFVLTDGLGDEEAHAPVVESVLPAGVHGELASGEHVVAVLEVRPDAVVVQRHPQPVPAHHPRSANSPLPLIQITPDNSGRLGSMMNFYLQQTFLPRLFLASGRQGYPTPPTCVFASTHDHSSGLPLWALCLVVVEWPSSVDKLNSPELVSHSSEVGEDGDERDVRKQRPSAPIHTAIR